MKKFKNNTSGLSCLLHKQIVVTLYYAYYKELGQILVYNQASEA